ncbi:unnamed protein product [Trichobilharzia szidati]|nr:unnamed protein product [Trichobilharzia szidati]
MKLEEFKESPEKSDSVVVEQASVNDNVVLSIDRKHRCSEGDDDNESGQNGTGPSEPKRQCLSASQDINNDNVVKVDHEFQYWFVFTVVTAGRQGSELGADQTPLVQFNGVLGDFCTNKIIDRITINLHPESLTRVYQCSTDSTDKISHSQMNTNSNNNINNNNNHFRGEFQTHTDWNITSHPTSLNTSVSPSTIESGKYTTSTHVNISAEAQEAIGLQDIGHVEQNALNFKESVKKILHWLQENGVSVDQHTDNKPNILLITENHQSVRNVLHAEAAYRGLDGELMNRSPWLVYKDIIGCCEQFIHHKKDRVDDVGDREEQQEKESKEAQLQNLFEAARALDITCEETKVASVKADLMANVMISLTEKGYRVKNPEFVHYNYEHKTFSRKLKIDDSQVVEIRQVPWTATPATIAHYFAGLNVYPGGVAIRLTDGRRSNTAIVAFSDKMNAQLALARNQHQLCGSLIGEHVNSTTDVNNLPLLTNHIANSNNNNSGACNYNYNNRSECSMDGVQLQQQQQTTSTNTKPVYLQIHPATGREFVQCTGCDQECVTNFLNQLTSGEQVVVRIRGLPYTTTKKQIVEFFKPVQVSVMLEEEGVYLVAYPDRRPTGDAFVLFSDDYTATKALGRHKDYLGDRYVELFKASPSEMVQVCYNVTQVHSSNASHKNHSAILDYHQTNPRTSIITSLTSNGGGTLTPANCSNLMNFISNNNSNNSNGNLTNGSIINSNINNNITNKEAHLNRTLNQLKSVMSSGALSNLSNLWNSSLLPLGLSHHLLTPLSETGLNGGNIITNNGTSSLPSTLPLASTTDPSTHLNHLLSSISVVNPVIRDLTDPTDPECPFARPLPIGGACAMVQLNELPLETSRHDIRLYLGPANFAKVYRMRRMENLPNSHTSTWLLSLINTNEAIQFIRDLVNRTFTITTVGGVCNRGHTSNTTTTNNNNSNSNNGNKQMKILSNIPTFALYSVNQEGKLSVIILSDIGLGIPLHRIHPTSCGRLPQPAVVTVAGAPTAASSNNETVSISNNNNNNSNNNLNWSQHQQQQSIKFPITTKYDDQNILNTVTSPVQLSDPHSVLKRLTQPVRNFDISHFINSIPGLNLQSPVNTQDQEGLLLPTSLIPSTNQGSSCIPLDPKLPTIVNDASIAQNRFSQSGLTASMVMLTGAPVDATQEELASLFNPVRHLLTAQPYFIPFQYQPNGTANFLACFNNPLDAQTAVHYCPNGSLRSSQYIIGAACLIPPTNMITLTANKNYPITPVNILPVNTTNMLLPNSLMNSSNLPQRNDLFNSGILFIPPNLSSQTSASSSPSLPSTTTTTTTTITPPISVLHPNQLHFQ